MFNKSPFSLVFSLSVCLQIGNCILLVKHPTMSISIFETPLAVLGSKLIKSSAKQFPILSRGRPSKNFIPSSISSFVCFSFCLFVYSLLPLTQILFQLQLQGQKSSQCVWIGCLSGRYTYSLNGTMLPTIYKRIHGAHYEVELPTW